MIHTYNLMFHLRYDKKQQDGTVPIYCRITIDGQRAELALKRYVLPDRWSPSRQLPVGRDEQSRGIARYIETVRAKLNEHQRLMEEAGKEVTAKSLKDEYLGVNQKSQSLVALFEDHNAKVKALIGNGYAAGTYERYQTCLRHLKAFIRSRYDANDFNVRQLDYKFISEFDFYLRTARKCANNSAVKYLKNFKKVVRLAISYGWISADPFLHYNTKLEKIDRGFLTQTEIDTVADKFFDIPRLDMVRDAFLFQCYTGLAYADMKKLTPANVVRDEQGNLWISTERKKTGNPVNVPLLEQALRILDKYRGHPLCATRGVLLPVLSNQKMNAYLKEIGDVCGIRKRLSSHLGRHSFGTSVTLANGVSLEAVSKMLGHSDMSTTRIYARMLDSRVSDEMTALRTKLRTTDRTTGFTPPSSGE